MRVKLLEIVFITIHDFLQKRNSTPTFSARLLISLSIVFNVFTFLILVKKFNDTVINLPNATGLYLSIVVFFAIYYAVYYFTKNTDFLLRVHLNRNDKKIGALVSILYVSLSYILLFTAFWSIKID